MNRKGLYTESRPEVTTPFFPRLWQGYWQWFVSFVVLIMLIGITGAFTFLGYYWTNIGDQYIGVETIRGQVTDVKLPGIRSNGTMWADLYPVNVSQLQWCAVDPEVITKDNQRLGFVVCGTVQRPGFADFVPGTQETYYKANGGASWIAFKQYYRDDALLAGSYHMETSEANANEQNYVVDSAGLMQQLAQQAMKSCVGDRDFQTAVVGSARDELRECIDLNISKLAENYGGLKVQNVTVPNVILRPEVQAKLDEITTSKFETELAKQNALKEKSIADTELAKQQGVIRVAQGQQQEEARQMAETQRLQADAEKAKQALIEAQKANDLLSAGKDVEINKIRLEAAILKARADNAWDVVLADIMATNPSYAYYMWMQTAAGAWKATDKVIVPAGSNPFTIINPWGTPPGIVAPTQ